MPANVSQNFGTNLPSGRRGVHTHPPTQNLLPPGGCLGDPLWGANFGIKNNFQHFAPNKEDTRASGEIPTQHDPPSPPRGGAGLGWDQPTPPPVTKFFVFLILFFKFKKIYAPPSSHLNLGAFGRLPCPARPALPHRPHQPKTAAKMRGRLRDPRQ